MATNHRYWPVFYAFLLTGDGKRQDLLVQVPMDQITTELSMWWAALIALCVFVVAVLHACIVYISSGKLSRSCEFLFVTIPEFLSEKLPLGGFCTSFLRCKYTLLGLYFVIYSGLVGIFMSLVYPNFCMFLSNPEFHNIFSLAVIPIPVVVVFLLQVTNPGNINADNVDDYLNTYPYDSLIYHPAKCGHLRIPAVPRSRFCSFTGHRVARFDHYNPWLAQAVGERNTGLYVLFLLANLSILTYYTIVCLEMLNWKCDTSSTSVTSQKLFVKVLIALNVEPIVSGLIPFLMICSVALLCILVRQMYLISVNKTTPEVELFQQEIERRRREGIREQVHNIYDEGVFLNWFEILLPPVIENRKKRS